tara:strand:+ start:92 stop:436 length:345 start_codon:yes stop_codon:yes gene_type:complete
VIILNDISELFQGKIMSEIAVFRDKSSTPSYRTVFTYRNYFVVVKRFGSSKDGADFSIKLFKNPGHLIETFKRWNTNIRVISGSDREFEYAIEQFNIFLVDVGCNPINDENPTD